MIKLILTKGDILHKKIEILILCNTQASSYLTALYTNTSFQHRNNMQINIDSQCAPCYTKKMIKSFNHKGIKLFFEKGNCSGIQAKHRKRLRMQLSALDTSHVIEDMDLPGYGLHKLKGDRKNCWSIVVNGNWRLTFEFFDGNAYIVNYEDYH